MIGETILHYKILEKLGQGGMGVVYLAEDLNLERKVAIKFLPRHIADNSEERERFKIEAKAAAALNQTNIATIHAIEESSNDTFIVMEYIDGIELKDKIKSGSIPTNEAINIAIQIAEGLEAAHKKGIVHRDIKSQNLMITENSKVKIMDFGLAKVGKGTQLTKIGFTVGTAAYMSPEQTRGEEVDNRTDIWSFGVVFYEMMTGKLPFKGDYDQAIIYSILNEEPQFKTLTKEVPETVETIILKALNKNPEERFQNVSEILSDLKVMSGSSDAISPTKYRPKKNANNFKLKYIFPALVLLIIAVLIIFFKPFSDAQKKIESIAVLPLTNLSGDQNQEYIADGMTDALITQLSKISALHVISRQSIIGFKNSTIPLKEIAAKLGVDAVVEGSVTIAGDRIQISTNLIEALEERHLWGEEYERDFKDILSLQKDVTSAIAKEIAFQLTPRDKIELSNSKEINPEAYKSYLKGIQLYKELRFKNAIEYFEKTIEKEPDFGLAYSELLKSYCIENPTYEAKAILIAKKLVKDYPELPEAQIALTVYYSFYEGRFDLAENAIQKAIELNPGNSEAHREYGLLLGRMTNNKEKSLQEMNVAKKMDPLSPEIYTAVAEIYIKNGQYEQAFQEIQNSIEINPDFKMNSALLGWIYVQNNSLDKGIELLEKNPSAFASVLHLSAKAMLGYANAVAGKKKIALKYLEEAIEGKNHKTAAIIYFGLNEIEKGIKSLQLEFDLFPLAETIFLTQLESDPFWKPMQKDARFQEFVNRLRSHL